MRFRPRPPALFLTAACVAALVAGSAHGAEPAGSSSTPAAALGWRASYNGAFIPLAAAAPSRPRATPEARLHVPAWRSTVSLVEGFPGGVASLGVDREETLRELVDRFRLNGVRYDAKLRLAEVRGASGDLASLLAHAVHDPRVRYVEPPQPRQLLRNRNDPFTYTVDAATGRPFQWWFSAARFDRAFNLSTGSPDILVGVIDSGIADVVDLSGKVAESWYFPSQGTNASDTDGHGTFVSAIVASKIDDGVGLAGGCGHCRLVVHKVEPLTNAGVASAIRHQVDRGVRVLNMSFGGPGLSLAEVDALNYAIQKGVLLVAAAGNDGIGSVSYPAAYLQPDGGAPSWGLAVGASDEYGARVSFSSYGARLSMLAPGGHSSSGQCGAIASAVSPLIASLGCSMRQDPTTGARYAYSHGTSFAAPAVAGAAALVWAARPDLLNYQVAHYLKQSAARPSGSSWTPDRGWGTLDAARALELVTGRSSADALSISGLNWSPGQPRPGDNVTLAANVAWTDGVAVASGSVSCTATLAGQPLATTAATLAGGMLTCGWTLPPSASYGLLVATVAATAEGTSTSVESSTSVDDLVRPTAQALVSNGRYLRRVSLRYRLHDDSGNAGVRFRVLRNGRPVKLWIKNHRTVVAGRTYVEPWRAPARSRVRKKQTWKFCVLGEDRAGNFSAERCARLVLR